MYRFQQAKKKFGQITWLMLGLCFVLLYSCPVKKFLILYFEKTNSAAGASTEFMKAHSAQHVRIVYLHRDSSVYTVLSPVRPFRPVIPSLRNFFTVSCFFSGTDLFLTTSDLLPSNRQSAYAGDPPRYLQLLRLRI